MLNPNKGSTGEVLSRLKDASEERMRVELLNSIRMKMVEFEMSWDDIAVRLGRPLDGGSVVRKELIGGPVTLKELNALTHIFSCEPYIIFRPREPWTRT